eukprot:gene20704-25378_t
MDEVIYEEFKGTGNCEIHLDRRMAEKRVYPSLLINKSGTRREELLLKPEILQKSWILRKLLYNMDEIEAMEFILEKMKASKNNHDFFDMMRRGGGQEVPMKDGIHPNYREVCFQDLSNGFKFVTRSC